MARHKVSDDLVCPWCGATNTGASNADGSDNKPSDGAYTICIECYGVGEFFTMQDGRLNIKPVSLLALDPGNRAAIHAAKLRLIHAKRQG